MSCVGFPDFAIVLLLLQTDELHVIPAYLLRAARFNRQLLLVAGTSGQPNEDLSLFPWRN